VVELGELFSVFKSIASFFSSFVLTMSSCMTPASYDEEYTSFYQDAAEHACFVSPVPVYFARLEPEIAGYCVPSFGILLNENHWGKYGPYQRLELMYHELGHCALGLDHSEGLMSPAIHSEKEVEANWSEWREELFTGCFIRNLEPSFPLKNPYGI
jgi:hypothetical protein